MFAGPGGVRKVREVKTFPPIFAKNAQRGFRAMIKQTKKLTTTTIKLTSVKV